jgi:hypothetical protein
MNLEHWWNGTDGAELKYLERILSATLSTANPTWPGLELNKSLHCEESSIKRLSHCMAVLVAELPYWLGPILFSSCAV